MDPKRMELIEKFFGKARLVIMIDESAVAEVNYKKGEFTIDVKKPLPLMGLGIDMQLLKTGKEKSVIRKAIKDLGFRIKLKYKLLEIEI